MKLSDILKKGAASAGDESDETVDARLKDWKPDAAEAYAQAVDAARALYRAAAAPEGPLALPKEAFFKLVRLAEEGKPEILALAERSTPDNYLYAHVVNVTILSLRLAVASKLPPADLRTLAAGAFLHDLGMLSCLPVALKAEKFTDEEREALRQYPARSQAALARFASLTGPQLDIVRQIVGQVHERAQGKGYPEKLPNEAIHPLAKIVGVCDVYEAITHPRSWRPRLLPHEAMRLMIEEHEDEFDAGLVKDLVEALSFYPAGSFVRLSSGHVGRVVAPNAGLPTRPSVRLFIDGDGRRLEPSKLVNLALEPVLYVAEAVDETRLPTPDKRLRTELRARRWWVSGM